MIIHPRKHLLLPLLALSLTLPMAAPVRAQDRHDRGPDNASVTLQVTFGNMPHWTGIRGTRVQEIRQRERPDYDMFRYGGAYYAFKNNRWYTSRRMRGGYTVMDDGSVPRELSRVPRGHWRNYPSGWSEPNNDPRHDGNGRHH